MDGLYAKEARKIMEIKNVNYPPYLYEAMQSIILSSWIEWKAHILKKNIEDFNQQDIFNFIDEIYESIKKAEEDAKINDYSKDSCKSLDYRHKAYNQDLKLYEMMFDRNNF